MNSRQKGCRGEREWASFLRDHGYEAERGQQRAGGKDSPDVKTNMPNIHFEVKRTNRLRLEDAVAQSRRDAGDDEMPVVAYRKDHGKWLVIVDAEDFMTLFKAWEREMYGADTERR